MKALLERCGFFVGVVDSGSKTPSSRRTPGSPDLGAMHPAVGLVKIEMKKPKTTTRSGSWCGGAWLRTERPARRIAVVRWCTARCGRCLVTRAHPWRVRLPRRSSLVFRGERQNPPAEARGFRIVSPFPGRRLGSRLHNNGRDTRTQVKPELCRPATRPPVLVRHCLRVARKRPPLHASR